MRLAFLRSTKIAASAEPLTISSANHNAGLAVSPVRGIGETGCTVGWGCAVCCYDNEHPREDCPHGADHRGVTNGESCPTRAALTVTRRESS